MKNGDQKQKAVIALLIGIVFAIIISEVLLQLLDLPPRPVSGWLNCKDKNPGECNSMGFRGREISYSDDDFVVVLLGDSEVYAASFPFEKIPERLLERALKKVRNDIKVFTIGDMGYGQDQQYLALKEYFEKFRADLVVLMFTARNDIENNMFPSSGVNYTIKPTFWLEDGKLHGPTERWLEPLGPPFKLALLWQTYVAPSPGTIRMDQWKRDILPTPYQPLSHYTGKADNSWQAAWNKNPETAFRNIDYELAVLGNQFTPRSEVRLYGIELTRRLFSEIKKLTEAQNGHFVILKEERPWEMKHAQAEKVYFLNGKYYRLSVTQYRDNLRDIFAGFEHYRIPLNMEDYVLSPDDMHLNPEAFEKLFSDFSRILSEKEYFGKKH